MAFDPTRLLTQLNNTGLQNKDYPFYQFLKSLINGVQDITSSGGSSSGGTAIITNITNIGGSSPPGNDGDSGEDGPPGPPGTPGAQGTTGVQGPVGSIIIGVDGEDGIDGFHIPVAGPQGIQGAAGATGASGITILPEDGIDGIDGFNIPIQGPQGIQGIQGNTGPQGVPGPALFFLAEDGEDGLDGIPGSSGSGGTPVTGAFLEVLLHLTDAQIRTINSVPIQIVAAAGAGFILVPLNFAVVTQITSTFSVGTTLTVRWIGIALTPLPAVSPGFAATGKKLSFGGSAINTENYNATTNAIENKGLEVFGNSDSTGGATTNGVNIYLQYYIVAFP